MPRLKKKNNPYNLSGKLDHKHESKVVTIEMAYYVPEDEMHANVKIRQDVTDPALLVKLFRGVEKAMRAISPEYSEDIDLLEAVAKAYLVDGETDGSGQEQDNRKRHGKCRCQ
jgi:hypothetical protein